MKSMRKFATAMMAVSLFLSLTACGGGGKSSITVDDSMKNTLVPYDVVSGAPLPTYTGTDRIWFVVGANTPIKLRPIDGQWGNLNPSMVFPLVMPAIGSDMPEIHLAGGNAFAFDAPARARVSLYIGNGQDTGLGFCWIMVQ